MRVCQHSDILCYCLLFKGKLLAPFWCIDLSFLLFPEEGLLLNWKKYSTVTLLWLSARRNCFNMITNWRVTLNLPSLPWSAPVMLFNLKLSSKKLQTKHQIPGKLQGPSLSILKLTIFIKYFMTNDINSNIMLLLIRFSFALLSTG